LRTSVEVDSITFRKSLYTRLFNPVGA
jgi:hypothetical protein